MFYKALDNYHMCEHRNVMECCGPSQVTQTPRGDSLSSKQFVLFSKLFSVQQNKTPRLTSPHLGVCWSKTLAMQISHFYCQL